MNWLGRYRFRHYLENSIWILPLVSIVLAVVSVTVLHQIEVALGWKSDIEPETARAVLATMASSMFTFIVFISSALLVAFQLASAQLTPRIIALVFRQPITKNSLALFTFTFAFSLGALVRVNTSVPLLTSYIASYGALASLGFFFFLIDSVGKFLRPSGALQAVGIEARKIIENVYPNQISLIKGPSANLAELPDIEPRRTIAARKNGVVLAFDMRGLVSLSRQADCVVELVPQVGDFVGADDPLFRVFDGGDSLSESSLRQCVAFGFERTLEQDPTFAFRIIVDIASKALSPAINDPTTAVLAIDQLHYLLRVVGNRQLSDGREPDATGKLRLVYRTPDWDDFVHLAITEIRQFGQESIQITRRLRAMLENLIETLPERRVPLLREELGALDRSVERFFQEPGDRALANASDLQGMGGDTSAEDEERGRAQSG